MQARLPLRIERAASSEWRGEKRTRTSTGRPYQDHAHAIFGNLSSSFAGLSLFQALYPLLEPSDDIL